MFFFLLGHGEVCCEQAEHFLGEYSHVREGFTGYIMRKMDLNSEMKCAQYIAKLPTVSEFPHTCALSS